MAASNVIQGCFPNGLPRFDSVPRIAQPLMAGRPAWVAAAIGRGGSSAAPAVQPKSRIAPLPPHQHAGATAVALPPHLAAFRGTGGQPLPADVRQRMESAFGTSFADVRIHVGAEASTLGATALTHGNHIYFAPGHYNPQALGHELAHVVQQRAGRVSNPLGGGIAVVHDTRMEAEASRMALQAARGLTIQRQIIADGQEGAGRLEAGERTTFTDLLTHNGKSSNQIQNGDWTALRAQYLIVNAKDLAIVGKKAGAKVRAKTALKTVYEKLMADVEEKYLGPGNVNWDAAVAAGVADYQGQGLANIDQSYKTVGGTAWTALNARGAMPDAFWQAIRTRARLAHGAALAGTTDLSATEQGKLTAAKASVTAAKGRWDALRVDGAAMPAQVNAAGTYGTADADSPWALLTIKRKTFEALLSWWRAKGANHTLGSSHTTGLALHATKVSATHSPKMIYHLNIVA